MISITGAEGFIGSHLVERLLNLNHSVRALVHYNSFNSVGWLENVRRHSELEIVLGDVRDPEQMLNFCEGSEIVIHLASLIAIPHSYVAQQSYLETNALGTMNVLNGARRAGVRRFIQTSTSEVYGSAISLPMGESHPLQAQSPYSASKIAADAMVFSYWSSFDFPATILRPFNTFGPRQSHRAVIPTLISQALKEGDKVFLGSLSPRRDFSFIEDTIDGYIRAVEAPGIEGEVINLGTGFDVSIGELVSLVGEVLGRPIVVDGEAARFRPDKSEVDCLRSDNSKAARLLGWSPRYAGREGLREGLVVTAKWLEEQTASGSPDASSYVT